MLRLPSLSVLLAGSLAAHDAEWPATLIENRPLVRWWWPFDLAPEPPPEGELERIARAGFGAVEVRPAPPVDDSAGESLPWLSPEWIGRYARSATAAEALGLRIDLAINGPLPGSLPPIPQPGSAPGHVDKALQVVPLTARANGGPFELPLPEEGAAFIAAWPRSGPPVDLTPFIDPEKGALSWDAPAGPWSIYGIGRSTDGGPDPLSTSTTGAWLSTFGVAFRGSNAPFPRAHTLEGPDPAADWSSALVPAFLHRRGYDLRDQLPALFGDAETGTVERVLGDYRQTLADLRRDSLITWHQWCRENGTLSRTHLEAPVANPLDLFAVADIPGMTVTGIPADDDLPQLAFAASAAHLQTKPLVSATILHSPDDLSLMTPEAMKRTADLAFLAGANQLVLDGIVSGTNAERPATRLPVTPLGPGSGRWENIRAFNDYLTRCQSVLQSGAPDPEVLLYFPTHDLLTERGGMPADAASRKKWFRPTGFHRAAMEMLDNGIPCDYVSDLILAEAGVAGGRIILGGLDYSTLVLPEVRQLPEQTAAVILQLANRGANITVLGGWPRDVPGFASPDIRRGTLFTSFQSIPDSRIIEGDDLVGMLAESGVIPEPMAGMGLHFIRRSHAEGHHYFITNLGHRPFEGWVPLATPAVSATLMDPKFRSRSGVTPVKTDGAGPEVRIRLQPGESRILKTFASRQAEGPAWSELQPFEAPRVIGGRWRIEFTDGGPELPDEVETPMLGSWNTLRDPRATRFSGTARYTIGFSVPEEGAWLLDLGGVLHTARVLINGNEAGSSYVPPHLFDVGRFVKAGDNTLEVEVTNLTASGESDDGSDADSGTSGGLLGPVRLMLLDK